MILLVFILFFQSTIPYAYAYENKTYYAKIMFEQVYLYKTPTNKNDMENIYFELPKTYFVKLLSRHDDFYEVRYLNIFGYVKKDSVQAVSHTPLNPFLTNLVYSSL